MNLFTDQIYPLHQDNELLFKISSIPISTNSDPPPHDQNHKIIINQDIFLLSPPPPAYFTPKLQDIKKQRRIHNMGGGGGGGGTDTGHDHDKHEAVGGGGHDGGIENKRKKLIMHRDIERQRRQEMASLYKSLRSLIPLQYLKGKRSMGDHMHEATNYIKHLEKKIKELNEKRDRLKRLSSLSHTNISDPVVQMKCFCRSEVVTVQQCLAGIEVVISCTDLLGFEGGGGGTVLSLSKVLNIIGQEGLDVVSCISTKASKTLVHKILSEVRNPNNTVNLSELQQKLEDVIRKSCESKIEHIYKARSQVNS